MKTINPEALKAIHDFLRFQIDDHHTGDTTEIPADRQLAHDSGGLRERQTPLSEVNGIRYQTDRCSGQDKPCGIHAKPKQSDQCCHG
jgi:hypothetical protein